MGQKVGRAVETGATAAADCRARMLGVPTDTDRGAQGKACDPDVLAFGGSVADFALRAICTRLEAMRERTPRRRTSWQPSSVKMLLDRAGRVGLPD